MCVYIPTRRQSLAKAQKRQLEMAARSVDTLDGYLLFAGLPDPRVGSYVSDLTTKLQDWIARSASAVVIQILAIDDLNVTPTHVRGALTEIVAKADSY